MISSKPAVIIAVLLLAGGTVAQDKTDEQRIAELIEQLGDESLRQATISMLVGVGSSVVGPLLLALDRDGGQIRVGVLETLGRLGPHGTTAVPGLLTLDAFSPEQTCDVLDALAGIAPWGGPYRAILEDLADTRAEPMLSIVATLPSHLRRSVVAACRRLEARTQVPEELSTAELISILDGSHRLFQDSGYRARPDVWVEAAAEVLGWRGADAERALSSLGVAYERYRMHASVRATIMRHRPESALTRTRIVERIGNAILKIAPEGRQAIPVYADRLMQGGWSTRKDYALVLGRFGSEAAPAVPALIECLKWGSGALHAEVITALGMIGPAAKEAIPTLEKLTDYEDKQIAERAKAALRQVRGR